MILPLPIRLRLALWFFAVFAGATLTIGCLSIWMVHRSILELENTELRQRVRSIERFLEVRPADESPDALANAISVYDVTHGGKWLQVIDQSGRWVFRSKHIETLFPSLERPEQVGSAERFFDFTTGDLHVRGLIAAIHVNGRSYTVQTGLTLNNRMLVMGNYRLHLMTLIPAILLMAAIAGYFVSSRALTPVAAITSEARRINSSNLDARLPVLPTRDELADMSETLNQMLDRIDSGYRSVKEFTANAAHELRTPVSLIRAEAEIALGFERSASDYQHTLQHIQAETIRMGRLIDDLLALARADAGVQRLHFKPLDVNQLLASAAERWRGRLRSSGIRLFVDPAEAEPAIRADEAGLERLLDILLENARRYSPLGGEVRLGAQSYTGSVVVSVTDSGIGIAPEHQDSIFERFYRVNPGNDGTEAQGSGLGLALARWIAEVHGTKVEVQSAPGKGSCFSVQFARDDRSLRPETAQTYRRVQSEATQS